MWQHLKKMYSPEILKAVLKRMSKEKIETLEGKKKIIAMLVNKIHLNNQGNIIILFNVLNGNEPIIAERWFRTSTCSYHQFIFNMNAYRQIKSV